MRREVLEKVVELTLEQVRERGWELLDENTNTQIQIVADAIEREVDDFVEDLEADDEWEDAMEELRNPSVLSDEEDDMGSMDDVGPLTHWNE